MPFLSALKMMEGLKTRYKVIDYDLFSHVKVFLEDFENNDVGVTDQQKCSLTLKNVSRNF